MIITVRRPGWQLCWPELWTDFSARTGPSADPTPAATQNHGSRAEALIHILPADSGHSSHLSHGPGRCVTSRLPHQAPNPGQRSSGLLRQRAPSPEGRGGTGSRGRVTRSADRMSALLAGQVPLGAQRAGDLADPPPPAAGRLTRCRQPARSLHPPPGCPRRRGCCSACRALCVAVVAE